MNGFEEKLAELRKRYIKRLKEDLNELKSAAGKLGNGADIDDLIIRVHKLAGSGGTYGYQDISDHAHKFEVQLISFSNTDKSAIEQAETDLQHLIEACQSALKQKPQEEATKKNSSEKTSTVSGSTNKSKYHVLLVDNDKSIQSLVKECLKGGAVVKAFNGLSEAIDTLSEKDPDLILLSNRLPSDLTGHEALIKLIDKLSVNEEDCPIVMLTASDDPDTIMECLTDGAVDYITKPFDAETLRQKVLSRLKSHERTVLIADDNRSVRELLAHKFRVAGCRVILSESGNEALDEMKEGRPDIVLLDRMMPGYEGMTVLNKMKEDSKLSDIPVIFLTAKHSDSDILDGINKGAVDYITKPFNPDEVVARCLRIIS